MTSSLEAKEIAKTSKTKLHS